MMKFQVKFIFFAHFHSSISSSFKKKVFFISQISNYNRDPEKGSSQCVKINTRKKEKKHQQMRDVRCNFWDLERQKINPFTLQCAFFGYFSFYYPFFLGILCYFFSLKNKTREDRVMAIVGYFLNVWCTDADDFFERDSE